MKEYIDKAALMLHIAGVKIHLKGDSEWSTGYCDALQAVGETVQNFPAADVVERKSGEWEDEYGGAFANPRYRCSVCKEKALYRHEQDCLGGWHEVQALTDFCPHCNADLRSHHDSLCDQTEEGEHDQARA